MVQGQDTFELPLIQTEFKMLAECTHSKLPRKKSSVWHFSVLPYPAVGDQEVAHRVALVLFLPFKLDDDVPVGHHPVTGPILSTLILKDTVEMQISWNSQKRPGNLNI